MKDAEGRDIRLGDRVSLWHGHYGTVVCAFDDGLFSARYTEGEWGSLERGVLIEADDGTIFHYPEADEDLVVATRTDWREPPQRSSA